MKKVSSKVIKSGPFVDRRFRNDPSKNKCRRTDDIPPRNITESHDINSAIYKVTSGRLKAANRNGLGGRLLDFYARILAQFVKIITDF